MKCRADWLGWTLQFVERLESHHGSQELFSSSYSSLGFHCGAGFERPNNKSPLATGISSLAPDPVLRRVWNRE